MMTWHRGFVFDVSTCCRDCDRLELSTGELDIDGAKLMEAHYVAVAESHGLGTGHQVVVIVAERYIQRFDGAESHHA